MLLEGLLLLLSSPVSQLVSTLGFHSCLAGSHLLPQPHTGSRVQGILLQQPAALPRLKLQRLSMCTHFPNTAI